jgi:hypothetical protein
VSGHGLSPDKVRWITGERHTHCRVTTSVRGEDLVAGPGNDTRLLGVCFLREAPEKSQWDGPEGGKMGVEALVTDGISGSEGDFSPLID